MLCKRYAAPLCAAILMAAGLGSSRTAVAQAPAADEASTPYEVVTMKWDMRIVLAGIAVPRQWQKVDTFSERIYLARKGLGDGVPEKDETGQTLTMGIVVTNAYEEEAELSVILAEHLKISKMRKLKTATIEKESTEKLTLADGTEALLLTLEYTQGERRALEYILLAKTTQNRPWFASGVIEAGKASKIPTTASPQAAQVRQSVVSFCFDPTKVDTSKWKTAGKK